MGLPKDMNLDDQTPTNPVDQQLLSFIWRKVGKPPDRWEEPMKNVSTSPAKTEVRTIDCPQ
jgi:hypothetical protein